MKMRSIYPISAFLISLLLIFPGCNDDSIDNTTSPSDGLQTITADNIPKKTVVNLNDLQRVIPGKDGTKPVEKKSGNLEQSLSIQFVTSVVPGTSYLPQSLEDKLSGLPAEKSKKPNTIPLSASILKTKTLPLKPIKIKVSNPVLIDMDSIKQFEVTMLQKGLFSLQNGDTIFPPMEVLAHQPSQFKTTPFKYKENTLLDISILDADQGLPNHFIRQILQDDYGVIWMATHTGGLISYDNKNFRQYTENCGLPSDMLLSMIIDSKNTIWMATQDAGICAFDGKSMVQISEKQGLPSNYVFALMESKNGDIWIGTRNGLSRLAGDSLTTFTKKEGLPNEVITTLCEDDAGNIWIGTNGGVSMYDGKGFINLTKEDGLLSNYVQALLPDHNGNIWIGTYLGGVNRYDGKSLTSYSVPQGLGNESVLCMVEDQNQNLWFGTFGNGVTRFDGTSFTNYATDKGLNDDYIRTMLEDNHGNLWIGSDGGVSRFNVKGFALLTKEQGLEDNLVLQIKQDQDENIWMSVFDKGLLVSEKINLEQENNFFYKITTREGLVSDLITCIFQDKNMDYWFAAYQGGLSHLDHQKFQKGILSFNNYTVEQGYTNGIVRAIAQDHKGTIWIASEEGLCAFDGEGFITLTKKEGLPSNEVISLYIDRMGALWLGTMGGGVSKYYQDTITNYTTDQGLCNNTVWSITQDKNGLMWFGTDGDGLSCFNGHAFRTFSQKDGLSNNYVFSLTVDDENSLWVGTVKGLSQLLLPIGNSFETSCYDNTLKSINYGKKDGLKGLDFYTNAAELDNENRLWWGTDKALTILDINDHRNFSMPPQIKLNGITINEKTLDFTKLATANNNIDRNNIEFEEVLPFSNLPTKLKLPYDKNHLTFHFAATDWSSTGHLNYQFKLLGFDNNWAAITNDNLADYRNISPGNYTFMVRAKGQSGKWSETVEYPFKIQAPVYYTWWAITGYILWLVGLVWLIVKWRVNIIQKQKKALEGMVRHRTKELNEALKIAEQATITKSQFIATISHEIRTPLNAIMGMTHLTLNTQLTAKQEDFLQKIDKSAVTLLGLINDILDFSKIEAGKLQLEKVYFDIETVLNSVIILNAQNAQKKDLEFVIDVDPKIPRKLIGDPLRLGQIMTNLCNNAIKFTNIGEVVVRLTRGEQINKNEFFMQVEVKDTGIGIGKDQIPTLFDEFKQADNSITRKFGGTGLGLSISKLLVEMMGGQIWIKSRIGEGSSFFFTSKMGVQELSGQHITEIPDELKQLNILVCDDNISSCKALVSILKSFSLTADASGSGEEVLDLLDTKSYDLLLIDQKLTNMSGLETILAIRKNSKILPLKSILIADNETSKLSFESTILGIDGYLSKPYIPSVVIEKILSIFGMEKPASRKRTEYANKLNDYKQVLTGKHFILAEDNEVNSEVILGLLSNVGVKVDLATDGASAFQMIMDHPYDLILMDLHMPIMDGFEAAIQLKSRKVSIPIIAITAESVAHVEQKCKQAGIPAILPKPVDPELFYQQVLKSLNLDHSKVDLSLSPDDFMGLKIPITDRKELDTEMGIRRFGNNPELYFRMLMKFVASNSSNIEDIKKLIKLGDYKQAHLKIHSFKGESGNLGADKIAAGALQAELAIKMENLNEANHTLAFLEKNMQDFNAKITPFLKDLKLNSTDSSRSIREIITELIACIQNNNPKTLDLLDELSSTDFDQAAFDSINQSIQNRAGDEAIALLNKYLYDR